MTSWNDYMHPGTGRASDADLAEAKKALAEMSPGHRRTLPGEDGRRRQFVKARGLLYPCDYPWSCQCPVCNNGAI